ncbi:MAG: methylenetetrahydrofolate--tRNA-(uracil(54)-C(5))-methyltransferase (FADH(2)-oxidizing) TrmFO [Clostridia bacterium]|nr:methylenetetrahydrofolate--tRNA-(uracil(54)-C(5))-methyltransferase (FADH(2)-oxidizing) TrmFO [Clostridia bacterium]
MNKKPIVIGAGLAGVEAAWQLARAGYEVDLYEMRPIKMTPAHKTSKYAELVCSNSLKAMRTESAAGMLKEEMRMFSSLCMECADKSRVPAGGALAVDREKFSQLITEKIENEPLINVIHEEVTEIPDGDVVIVAAGPLASDALAEDIRKKFGDSLSFFDAAAPIVSGDSIDMNSAFCQSRYDRGGEDDYINCPMNKQEYEDFYSELINAQRAELHEFEKNKKVYEGCMPIEIMATRGPDTMRFGPMKPVGLIDPHTSHRPWAVLQLRKENVAASAYNLVGFQTNLKFSEQKRVFSMIPALKNAEFLRYGVMHRNTFLNSPEILNSDFSVKERKGLFFAGQITGVEGYMESASSGIMAGFNAVRLLKNKESLVLPPESMIGALSRYISNEAIENFQPMGANFGVLPPLDEKIRDKKLRYSALAQRGLEKVRKIIEEIKTEG